MYHHYYPKEKFETSHAFVKVLHYPHRVEIADGLSEISRGSQMTLEDFMAHNENLCHEWYHSKPEEDYKRDDAEREDIYEKTWEICVDVMEYIYSLYIMQDDLYLECKLHH